VTPDEITGDAAMSQAMTALLRCVNCGETAGIKVFIAAYGGMVAPTAAVHGHATVSSTCPSCGRVSDFRVDLPAQEGSTV